jgi:hypothetical protein
MISVISSFRTPQPVKIPQPVMSIAFLWHSVTCHKKRSTQPVMVPAHVVCHGVPYKSITWQKYYWQKYYSILFGQKYYSTKVLFGTKTDQYLRNLNTWDTLINKRGSRNKLKWLVQRGHAVVGILDRQLQRGHRRPICAHRRISVPTNAATDRPTERTDRQNNKQTERPTDRQTDRQQTKPADYRQRDKQTDR